MTQIDLSVQNSDQPFSHDAAAATAPQQGGDKVEPGQSPDEFQPDQGDTVNPSAPDEFDPGGGDTDTPGKVIPETPPPPD